MCGSEVERKKGEILSGRDGERNSEEGVGGMYSWRESETREREGIENVHKSEGKRWRERERAGSRGERRCLSVTLL